MQSIHVSIFKEVVQNRPERILCIDVRSPEEYQAEHIEGVETMPLSKLHLHTDSFKNIDAVYVHCQSGGRSMVACEVLQKQFPSLRVCNVEGGILAWKESGSKTVL
jgi:rhodanese-related sulfurtransferase